jgi:hypothetical protein
VLVRPPVGRYTAVGLEVSGAFDVGWTGVSDPCFRFYVLVSFGE